MSTNSFTWKKMINLEVVYKAYGYPFFVSRFLGINFTYGFVTI